MNDGTKEHHWTRNGLMVLIAIFLLNWIVAIWWSKEPDAIELSSLQPAGSSPPAIGIVTTNALIAATQTLLDKHGGYLSNDMMPPSVLMDNMPSWEFGVLVQIRDLARYFRKDFSRSQSQSEEDKDLAAAEPMLNFSNDSWMFPATESEYRTAIERLESYRKRLGDPSHPNAQFYARADNLRRWLEDVEKRLGSMSQRLSFAVGQTRVDTSLAGNPGVQLSTPRESDTYEKTPWLQVDDIFYESRGSCWALILFLQAINTDFADVLQKKNAVVSLRQIIRELEGTQKSIWSPMVLNGTDFGMVANYSLVMASYISRANAAIIDLRALLEQG